MVLLGNPPILLDASVALVLFATGRITDVVRSLSVPVFVVLETIDECRFLRTDTAHRRVGEKEDIDWSVVLKNNSVQLLTRSTDQEFEDFIRFAARVDDGEAAAAASARQHGYRLAIDDRKARRIFMEEIDLIWSSEILRHWCVTDQVSDRSIRAILGQVRRKAAYLPHRPHPLFDWWQHYSSFE